MSKTRTSPQARAKEAQGYTTIAMQCGTCLHFVCDLLPAWEGSTYMAEKNKRCAIGGFAVKKMAICNKYKLKSTE